MPTLHHSPGTLVLCLKTNLNQSVVFLDAGVSDYQSLQAGVIPEVATVILSANQDGIEQISAFLPQNPQISTIHIYY